MATPKEAASRSTAVTKRRPAPATPVPPKPESERILDMVEMALQKGEGPSLVDTIRQLTELRNRQEDRVAAREFFEALSKVRAQFPVILRNRTGKNTGQQSGASFAYKYADLDHIVRTVSPMLTAEGFMWYWTTLVEAGSVTKICHLRHVGGHEETSPAKIPTESRGGMSEQQKVSAAGTFAMRLSFVDILGITTADPDLDGQQAAEYERITEGEATDIQALIDEVDPKGERKVKAGLLKWLNVGALADCPRSRYTSVIQTLEKKRAKAPVSAPAAPQDAPSLPDIHAAGQAAAKALGAQESLL